MAGELKRGDKVLIEATVVHCPAGSGNYVVKANGIEVDVLPSEIKGGEVPTPEPKQLGVKASIDISQYRTSHLLEALESWEETIKGLGYLHERMISDDDQTAIFWCVFETDPEDSMHARDRAQETMQELEASGGVEWEYVEAPK